MAKADFIKELVAKRLEKPMEKPEVASEETMGSKQAVARELLDAIKADDENAVVDAISSLVDMVKDEKFELED